jgi:hypothetical protein
MPPRSFWRSSVVEQARLLPSSSGRFGHASAPGRCRPWGHLRRRLRSGNGDPFRLGRFALGQPQLQEAILEARRYLLLVNDSGQLKGALEAAITLAVVNCE